MASVQHCNARQRAVPGLRDAQASSSFVAFVRFHQPDASDEHERVAGKNNQDYYSLDCPQDEGAVSWMIAKELEDDTKSRTRAGLGVWGQPIRRGRLSLPFLNRDMATAHAEGSSQGIA